MGDRQTHVIVGAGLAGATAADGLRANGAQGRVVLVGAESHHPYDRPPLSKQLLRGDTDPGTISVHPPSFYDDHGIELYTDTFAEGLDTFTKILYLNRGPLRYDQLLLATGSRPTRLHVPGGDVSGIHYLRTIDDVNALRAAAATAERVAVIGDGWLASEVAASLSGQGRLVALVTAGPSPLHKALGSNLSYTYARLHAAHGVALHPHCNVRAFTGGRQVTGILTDDGTVLCTDLVVVAIGAEPRLELALNAGLRIEHGGVAVNEYLASSAPDVFAAGDIAAAEHPLLERRIRLGHWDNAQNQGVVAARNMLGHAIRYDRIPYVFSDQHDVCVEYIGHARAWDQVAVRGNLPEHHCVVFWLHANRIRAALSMNVWDVSAALQTLVRCQAAIPSTLLADPSIPLAELADAWSSKPDDS